MPLVINQPNQPTDLEQQAAGLYRQQFDKITDRAEQIRRERTTNTGANTMPTIRAESGDTEKRLADIEKTVVDLAVQLERIETRIARLEPDQPSKPGDDPSETEANNLWRASIAKHQASSQTGPGVVQ